MEGRVALQVRVTEVPWYSVPLGTLRDTLGAGTAERDALNYICIGCPLTGDTDWYGRRGNGNNVIFSCWRYQSSLTGVGSCMRGAEGGEGEGGDGSRVIHHTTNHDIIPHDHCTTTHHPLG